MSVVIWKDGVSSLCEPKYLANELAAGYTLENIKKEVKKEESDEDKDIRLQAKELGIKSPHNKKIPTLIKEIEAKLNDSD
jgi:hypothetical protein